MRPTDVTVSKIDCLGVTSTSIGRGRPKKTWIEHLENDLNELNFIDKSSLDCTK